MMYISNVIKLIIPLQIQYNENNAVVSTLSNIMYIMYRGNVLYTTEINIDT